MSEDAFKFFIEPAIGAELEGRSSGGTDATGKSDQYKQDWLLRLHFGPQYDFNRYLGLYASAGMTVGMVRALNAFMEVQVGLQARIP
jgi:opacity protein-like surface antigen